MNTVDLRPLYATYGIVDGERDAFKLLQMYMIDHINHGPWKYGLCTDVSLLHLSTVTLKTIASWAIQPFWIIFALQRHILPQLTPRDLFFKQSMNTRADIEQGWSHKVKTHLWGYLRHYEDIGLIIFVRVYSSFYWVFNIFLIISLYCLYCANLRSIAYSLLVFWNTLHSSHRTLSALLLPASHHSGLKDWALKKRLGYPCRWRRWS